MRRNQGGTGYLVLLGLLCVGLIVAGLVAWKGTQASYNLGKHLLPQPPLHLPLPLPTKQHNDTSGYDVRGASSLTVDFMNRVLAVYHSPAAGLAQVLADDGQSEDIDAAYALAFFMHESTFGTRGVARTTLSLSNMRCVPEYACYNQGGGYAQFASWEQGFSAWFKMIRTLYIGQWGLTTVDQIIPVYAPASDHNNVLGYIAAVEQCVNDWHAGTLQC